MSAAFDSWAGLPRIASILGVAIFLVVVVIIALYRHENMEEKAVQSLGLAEAMERVEIDFMRYLEEREPLEQLLVVYEQVYALEATHFQAMPKKDGRRDRIRDYVEATVNENCQWWGDEPPRSERRERDA